MKVLGFDTATSATAVGLMLGEARLLEARDDPPAGAHPGHATKLLGMADRLLEQEGLRWRDLDALAVGVGPGTFTGLRVGVATARGLSQSLGLDLIGVSSLGALALGAREGCSDEDPRAGVLAVIDARRGEVFLAAYDRSGNELLAPRPVAPELLGQTLATVGSGRPWTAVGDGAVRYRAAFEELAVTVPAAADGLHLLRGGAVCRLAAAEGSPAGPAGVLPDYRRRPDAEIALVAAAGRAGAGDE